MEVWLSNSLVLVVSRRSFGGKVVASSLLVMRDFIRSMVNTLRSFAMEKQWCSCTNERIVDRKSKEGAMTCCISVAFSI